MAPLTGTSGMSSFTRVLTLKGATQCSKGHPLSPGVTGQGYRCDVCSSTGTGSELHNRCAICQWDACPRCSTVTATSTNQPQTTANFTCPRGHGMTMSSLGEQQGAYQCGKCSSLRPGAENHYNCRNCQYSICPNCSGTSQNVNPVVNPVNPVPVSNTAGAGNSAQGPNCFKAHPTYYTNIPQQASCDKCRATIGAGVLHARCTICSFDYCINCGINNQPITQPNPAGAATGPPCPKGHGLTTYKNIPQQLQCDRCHNGIPTGVLHANCSSCGYDFCINCGINPQAPITQTPPTQPLQNGRPCKMGHATGMSTIQQQARCDSCSGLIPPGTPHMRCTICQWDYCVTCGSQGAFPGMGMGVPPGVGMPGMGAVPGMSMGPTCLKGHSCTVMPMQQLCQCDLCHQQIQPGLPHPRCQQCGFDMCMNCASKTQGMVPGINQYGQMPPGMIPGMGQPGQWPGMPQGMPQGLGGLLGSLMGGPRP